MVKQLDEHPIDNLCVNVPFLNATKGREVVIHQRNYRCTWQYRVKYQA